MEKLKEKIFIIMCISMLFNIVCFMFITYPNMINEKERLYESNNPMWWYESQHPKFDYFNGLYLIGAMLFIVFSMIFFDLPSFNDIYKKIYIHISKYKYSYRHK